MGFLNIKDVQIDTIKYHVSLVKQATALIHRRQKHRYFHILHNVNLWDLIFIFLCSPQNVSNIHDFFSCFLMKFAFQYLSCVFSGLHQKKGGSRAREVPIHSAPSGVLHLQTWGHQHRGSSELLEQVLRRPHGTRGNSFKLKREIYVRC